MSFFHDYLAFDALNLTPANPSDTPAHIYPEWYFLWMLQLLKSFFFDIGFIKGSYIGMASLVVVNMGLLWMPLLDKNPRRIPAHQRPYFCVWFWALVLSLVALTILGKLPTIPAYPVARVSFLNPDYGSFYSFTVFISKGSTCQILRFLSSSSFL
ncbi:MAG: hypothetical protein LRY68_11665 [Sulfurospirillum sp.]|nr:hypothetical protein [Sulfurospirillum sp.]